MSLRGIDISSYQSSIDLTKVPSDFVIVKSTQGNSYKNPHFEKQIDQAIKANKLVGIYHYATGIGVDSEVSYFLSVIKPYIGKAILCLDWETGTSSAAKNSQFTNVPYAKRFMDLVKEKTGVISFLYASKSSCIRAFDCTSVAKAGYPLWGAQYRTTSIVNGYQSKPWQDSNTWGVFGWKDLKIFQYASTGRLSGYTGNLDLNIAYMTKEEWQDYAKGNKIEVTEPPKKEDIKVMTIAEAQRKVIKIAESQVGYSSKDKKTKYAAELDKIGYIYNYPKNGYDWCDVFYDWCMIQAFGVELAIRMIYQPKNGTGAGCKFSAQFYRQNKAWATVPTLGSQIFFGRYGDESHTGVVVGYTDTTVTTVEGNTGGGGGTVKRKTYNRAYANISGYGVPNWSLVTKNSTMGRLPNQPATETVKVNNTIKELAKKMPEIKRGSLGKVVKIWQVIIGVDVDGSFGPDTEAKTKTFQKKYGLKVDGIVGPKTWPVGLESVSK